MYKEEFISNPNVHILDKAFYMPQLKRYRRVWIYMPPEYQHTGKQYPVLYMHDGQNLFEEATSFGDEWGVDETLGTMRNKSIIVGIDNGEDKRGSEYSFHDTEQFGRAEGREYLEFISYTLKPYIDSNLRTFADSEHTIIAGSSMGGPISFYAGLYFPHVFGIIGALSPAFWIAPQTLSEVEQRTRSEYHCHQKIYLSAGVEEGAEMVENVHAIGKALENLWPCMSKTAVNDNGGHDEKTWGREFRLFYKWAMRGGEESSK